MMKVLNKKEASLKEIDLTIPSLAEMVKVVRLTVSGIASSMGFGIDSVEDIKVAIAEICNIIIKRCGLVSCRYRLKFIMHQEMLEIKFLFEDEKPEGFKLFDDDEVLGEAIVNALVDDVLINKSASESEIISITLFLKESQT